MQQFATRKNFAARVGGWSASHWKSAVLLWLVFVVAAVFLGSAAGTKTTAVEDQNVGEARRADHILARSGLRADPQDEYVLMRSTRLDHQAPGFRAVVADVLAALEPHRAVFTQLRSPYANGSEAQIAGDGRTVFVTFRMKGDNERAKANIDPIVAAVERVQAEHPGFYVGEVGPASTGKAIGDLLNKQLEDAGVRSVPLTLMVLFLVFGAAVAAFIPILLSLSAVIASLGILAGLSHVVPTDPNVSVVVLLIGLAVGVDYSLFYLKRRRDERDAGKDKANALATASATSGRTILISGITVLIAMAGMMFSGDKTFISFSMGTMTVVAVAMVASLTVLPALLSRLGDGVDRGRIPYLSRAIRRRSGSDHSIWGRIIRGVMHRPVISAIAATTVLVALALPAMHLATAQSGLDAMPADTPELATLHRFDKAFPGGAQPAIVAVTTPDVDAGSFRHALAKLERQAIAAGVTDRAPEVDVNNGHTAARLRIGLAGDGLESRSQQALATLRDEILPATLGTLPETEYAVGGLTAASHDYRQEMKRTLPIVFVFVLGFAFVLLLASFRSIVIATTSILMNLLSVAAAYGVLALVFQNTWAQSLLGFESNGAVAQWLPLFLFVILFGLSMDYHVFILSRIREAFDRGSTTDEAIEYGIRSTAGVVTSAALVMVGAFSLFATMPLRDMKQMGVGLAAAVLIDATIVRAVLLPAVMKLLGDRNWYLPSRLEWLPRINHGTEPPGTAAAGLGRPGIADVRPTPHRAA